MPEPFPNPKSPEQAFRNWEYHTAEYKAAKKRAWISGVLAVIFGVLTILQVWSRL